MPELPEVEVLVRHLTPLLKNRTVLDVQIRRAEVLRSVTRSKFERALLGARFLELTRRGKYLLFTLRRPPARAKFCLLGHLGMTGRMYLQPASAPLPKHVAAVFLLGKSRFVFEDTRCFGRLTLDCGALSTLGPEPLTADFSADGLGRALKKSAQAVKVKLLDQSLVAGLGNIYASEALFRAGISPRVAARKLTRQQIERLWRSIRAVLTEAIEFGSTVPLDWAGAGGKDRLFYYGQARGTPDFYAERLQVYGRAGGPCLVCRTRIRRITQAARSTFYCPRCQPA